MRLCELISRVSEIVTPETNDFYSYILLSSDDNGGFLRTRYCWRNQAFPDRKLHGEYRKIMVACNKEICLNDLKDKSGTNLKLQFHYDILNAEWEDAEWDIELGYRYVYIFDLDTNSFIMQHMDFL